MRWSEKPYELSGRESASIEGAAASVMRALDEFDPLGSSETNTMTDQQTRDELLFWLGDWRWCDPLGCAIVPRKDDMYRRADFAEVRRDVARFLGSRVMWAENACRRAKLDDGDISRAKAYLRFARKQDTMATVDRLAKSLRDYNRVEVDELDQNATLMGTPKGVLDLVMCELSSDVDIEEVRYGTKSKDSDWSAKAFNITKSTAGIVESVYETDAIEPLDGFSDFVMQICDGDEEKASFLQRALGYSMHGGNPEKATFVLWGPKRDNGKSTLMTIVKRTLGEYAGSVKPGMLLVNRFDNPNAANSALASLSGKRLVDVSEPPLGAELNGALLKQLASGNDEVSARFLHKDEFTFVPQFTLWLHCNALPVVRDPTAISPEHMFVIEFTKSFTGEERDFGLVDRFTSPRGMAAVMRWLLKGYRDYCKHGLMPPAIVRETTSNWLCASKTWLEDFLNDYCELGGMNTCGRREFKEAARAYCESRGEVFALQGMRRALKTMNVVDASTSKQRIYKGVKLREGAYERIVSETPSESSSESRNVRNGKKGFMLQ